MWQTRELGPCGKDHLSLGREHGLFGVVFFLDKYRIQSKTEMLTLVVACGMEGEGPAAHAPP